MDKKSQINVWYVIVAVTTGIDAIEPICPQQPGHPVTFVPDGNRT